MKKLRLRLPLALEILVINQAFIDLSFSYIYIPFSIFEKKKKDSGFIDRMEKSSKELICLRTVHKILIYMFSVYTILNSAPYFHICYISKFFI